MRFVRDRSPETIADVSLRDAERVGQDFDELGVRRAVDRRGIEPNEQRLVSRAGNPGLAGAGDDVDVDE